MRLYDAHNHLQDSRLDSHRFQILQELAGIGIVRAVVNGTREKDWDAVLNLSRENAFIIPSLGLHPWYLKERTVSWKNALATALQTTNCALGEIGLDRWMHDYDSVEQEEIFIEQLNLAAEFNRPVTIHCLKAWGRMLEIVSDPKLRKGGFLLHSYSGPAEMIQGFVKHGAYFSLSGYFAHERKARQRDVFRQIPLDRILVETDAPDMTPPACFLDFPMGEGPDALNDPANIAAIYRFGAGLFERSPEEFAQAIEQNFLRLFGTLL
jgi:TatD DNase family protein